MTRFIDCSSENKWLIKIELATAVQPKGLHALLLDYTDELREITGPAL